MRAGSMGGPPARGQGPTAWNSMPELQGELRAPARAGPHRDQPAVQEQDLPRDAEPHARPASLRREERHEDILDVLLGDPGAVVRDADAGLAVGVACAAEHDAS